MATAQPLAVPPLPPGALLPDYGGRSLLNLMASLAGGLGAAPVPWPDCALLSRERVAAARAVVLVVADGLGTYLVEDGGTPWLAAHRAGTLTSVFPATTAAAVGTLLTGLPPRAHGLTGWHVLLPEAGGVVAVLPWKRRGDERGLEERGVALAAHLDPRPLAARLGVPVHLLLPADIAGSPFSRAFAGPARIHPFERLPEAVERAAALARAGRALVHLYWPEVDRLAHEHGPEAAPVRAAAAALDRALERLHGALAGSGALLVVTADHGLVATDAAHTVRIDRDPEAAAMLRLPLSGEPRAAVCHLRRGAGSDFDAWAAERLAGRALCVPGAAALAAGWYGPGPGSHPRLAERAGDRMLLACGRWTVRDRVPGEEEGRVQRGVHGGLAPEEMRVPLALAGGE